MQHGISPEPVHFGIGPCSVSSRKTLSRANAGSVPVND